MFGSKRFAGGRFADAASPGITQIPGITFGYTVATAESAGYTAVAFGTESEVVQTGFTSGTDQRGGT